jgi:hypothetical protein
MNLPAVAGSLECRTQSRAKRFVAILQSLRGMDTVPPTLFRIGEEPGDRFVIKHQKLENNNCSRTIARPFRFFRFRLTTTESAGTVYLAAGFEDLLSRTTCFGTTISPALFEPSFGSACAPKLP